MPIQSSLKLHQAKSNVASVQASYKVTRYVYRASSRLKAGTILGNSGGKGSGPGGLDTVQREWDGHIVLETEWVNLHPKDMQLWLTSHLAHRGTPERAAGINRICTPVKYGGRQQSSMSAFKILRQRSRPGALCLMPLFDDAR